MESVRLRDGTEAVIWPLLRADREALRIEYQRLSPQSQHHRFLRAVPRLTEDFLVHLVDEVDGVHHVALVLFAFPSDGDEVPAGIARMVRYPDRPTAVDVAVTVADDWQGRGVATALLDALQRRRPPGVTEIITEVAPDNAASLAMLARLGDVRTSASGQGGLSVEVHLRDAPDSDAPGRLAVDGPVVSAARRALEAGDVDVVLPFVPADQADEVRDAFARATAARRLSDEARDLADRHFVETVVRIQHVGERPPAGR